MYQYKEVPSQRHRFLGACPKQRKELQNRFVIIDGVYSQDGDIAFLDQIYTVCKEHDAFLIVDDAHGIGVLGKTGRGIIEDYDLLDKVDIITEHSAKLSDAWEVMP